MDESGAPGSFMVIPDEECIDSFYPMLFGVSWAFFALRFLPEPGIPDENGKWSEIRNRMLKGSAHLMGLLVWRVQKEVINTEKSDLLQKLESAQREIQELKKTRSEDAKANEKVVSIFAAREQGWFHERKKLRQQIGALMNDSRVAETKNEKSVSEWVQKLKETELILQSKDEMIKESEEKRREVEEKLRNAEKLADELKEKVKNEICKHKTAFIELVSNLRRVEAETGRAVRQFEAAKQELDSEMEQKEEMVLMNQKLSIQLLKMHKDLEQKDQILSALLRKSKLDSAEKQVLLEEVKSSKAKRKQAELETIKWKAVSESKNERYSLRNFLPKNVRKSEIKKELEVFSLVDEQPDVEGSEHLVNSEAEKFKIAVEQRHLLEVDAFAEQLRIKDEKLEALQWRSMSMELELKRLKSHMEGLDHKISELRQDNIELENILLDRETELNSLKEQLLLHFSPPNSRKSKNFGPSAQNSPTNDHDTVWSQVKVIKRKPGHEKHEIKTLAEDIVLTLESPREPTEVIISKRSDCTWKMDIHALGISFKLKRLKQQLLMLERMTGKKESCDNSGLYTLMLILHKQVDRYQSLLGKIDDLCKRMHEYRLTLKVEDKSKRLEQFLEETFQLQRYMVATGQKLMEVQAKITSGFAFDAQEFDNHAGFDTERFADSITTLFREVQRGLEVRISRIIGDLEGTLACDGFHMS